MSVLCLVMIEAEASGVLYTRDPNDPRRNMMLINAVWGLGLNAVDGSVPTDFYEVDRAGGASSPPGPLSRKPSSWWTEWRAYRRAGPRRLAAHALPRRGRGSGPDGLRFHPGGALPSPPGCRVGNGPRGKDRHRAVAPAQRQPGRGAGPRGPGLERHPGRSPGTPSCFSQGRPPRAAKPAGSPTSSIRNTTCSTSPKARSWSPSRTSPRYVALLGRVQAIITDVGSVTGHMASVARNSGCRPWPRRATPPR